MGQFASVIPYDYRLETNAWSHESGRQAATHGVLLPSYYEIATMLGGKCLALPPEVTNKANCPLHSGPFGP